MKAIKQILSHRNTEIASQYKSGMTLDEVGQHHGITRERVRQIVSKLGITKFDGGSAINSFKNTGRKVISAREKSDKNESRCRSTWGMSLSDYRDHIAIYGTKADAMSPMRKYVQQRKNAMSRGLEWNFTFPDWWAVWLESGKWDKRGHGAGLYVMARYGDGNTPYSVDTVYICTLSQNSKDSYIVSPAAVRFANCSTSRGQGRGWAYVPGKSKTNPYVVHVRGKHIGQFPTPEKAHAAYLQAWESI